MILGAPHKEGTPRATPNRPEASFKSNNRDSILEDASSALEMKEMEGALKATQSHTLNRFLTQALAQRNQILALGGREVNVLGCVCPMVGQQQMKDKKGGYKYPTSKTSCYCALTVVIGTTDPRSVLPVTTRLGKYRTTA
jgi:hypothetical protein